MGADEAAMHPWDEELVREAAAGNEAAFASLFDRYQHLVYRFARAMTGSADAAEDITQEVFVVLMRQLPRYAPARSAFGTYLYGIARNVSRARLRRERRFLPIDALRHAAPAAGDRGDPFRHAASAQTTARLRAALATLPLPHREAVILCDLHDLSYAEAAAVVRSSVPAVRARLHRARRLLRQRLGMYEPIRRDAAGCVRCSV